MLKRERKSFESKKNNDREKATRKRWLKSEERESRPKKAQTEAKKKRGE